MNKSASSPETRGKIIDCIKKLFGDALSHDNIEGWCSMLMDEVDSYYDDSYSVSDYNGEICFTQWGEKEYYHDGSIEPYKKIRFKPISEEEYNLAKADTCESVYEFHNYRTAWMERGTERFLVTINGRSFDYRLFVKDLCGFQYVAVTIESGL